MEDETPSDFGKYCRSTGFSEDDIDLDIPEDDLIRLTDDENDMIEMINKSLSDLESQNPTHGAASAPYSSVAEMQWNNENATVDQMSNFDPNMPPTSYDIARPSNALDSQGNTEAPWNNEYVTESQMSNFQPVLDSSLYDIRTANLLGNYTGAPSNNEYVSEVQRSNFQPIRIPTFNDIRLSDELDNNNEAPWNEEYAAEERRSNLQRIDYPRIRNINFDRFENNNVPSWNNENEVETRRANRQRNVIPGVHNLGSSNENNNKPSWNDVYDAWFNGYERNVNPGSMNTGPSNELEYNIEVLRNNNRRSREDQRSNIQPSVAPTLYNIATSSDALMNQLNTEVPWSNENVAEDQMSNFGPNKAPTSYDVAGPSNELKNQGNTETPISNENVTDVLSSIGFERRLNQSLVDLANRLRSPRKTSVPSSSVAGTSSSVGSPVKESRRRKLVFGKNRTVIDASLAEVVEWSNSKKTVRDIINAVFTEDALAKSTVSGVRGAKPPLDRQKVRDIEFLIKNMYLKSGIDVQNEIRKRCNEAHNRRICNLVFRILKDKVYKIRKEMMGLQSISSRTYSRKNMVSIGLNHTKIHRLCSSNIQYEDYMSLTYSLLYAVFPPSTLATHTIDKTNITKPRLNPKKVEDIVSFVTQIVPEPKEEVLALIGSRCDSEHKLYLKYGSDPLP